MHARAVAILSVAVTFAAAPAAAAADRPCAGGEVAAVDQYCERLEAADGPRAAGAGDRTLADVLPPDVAARLARADPLGRTLLLVPAPAPDGAGAGGRAAGLAHLSVRGNLLPSGADADGALEAAGAVAQGEGVGGAFVWAFALSTVCLAGVAWYWRHR